MGFRSVASSVAHLLVAKRQVSFPKENSWAKIAWMQFLTQALTIGARLGGENFY